MRKAYNQINSKPVDYSSPKDGSEVVNNLSLMCLIKYLSI